MKGEARREEERGSAGINETVLKRRAKQYGRMISSSLTPFSISSFVFHLRTRLLYSVFHPSSLSTHALVPLDGDTRVKLNGMTNVQGG